jgi:hypothetical protein
MRLALFALALLLAGCASRWPAADGPEPDPVRDRALLLTLLPAPIAEREAWANDIYAAFSALQLPATAENYCSAIAVTEQESGFKADPVVPGLAKLARQEIESRAAALHIPKLVLRAALSVSSSDGRSFSERIDSAKTERELSEIYEDLIALVPLGSRLLAGRNPVRTGGPMQVSIAYAESLAEERTYPYPREGNIRREVFTRRGGMYFGIAHLLAYPAAYAQPLYRFADFNAGHYASRNAAFQQALSFVSGIPLKPDGDLIRHDSSRDDPPGETELAARVLGERIGLRESAIRRDLERGRAEDFDDTALYREVFALADEARGQPMPRGALPDIRLHSPKITRKLTTAWFANRVQERYARCLKRGP